MDAMNHYHSIMKKVSCGKLSAEMAQKELSENLSTSQLAEILMTLQKKGRIYNAGIPLD